MPLEQVRLACHRCKQPASLSDERCYYCGQPFDDVALPSEEPPPTQRSPRATVGVRSPVAISNTMRKNLEAAIESTLRSYGCELDSLILTAPSGQSSASAADDGSGPPAASPAANPWLTTYRYKP